MRVILMEMYGSKMPNCKISIKPLMLTRSGAIFSLLQLLIFVSLIPNSYKLYGVSYHIIYSFLISAIILVVNKFCVCKDFAWFSIFYCFSALLGVFNFGFATNSLLLNILSLVIFVVCASAYLYLDRQGYDIVSLQWNILYFMLFILLVEFAWPDFIILLRKIIYHGTTTDYSDVLQYVAIRDEEIMRGYRPFFIFSEASNVAKYLMILLVSLALLTDKIFKIIVFFTIFLFLTRSPTLLGFLVVLPLVIKKIKLSPASFFLLLLSFFVFLLVSIYMFYPRLMYVIEYGSRSIDERYILPFNYLFSDLSNFFGLGLGGHKPMFQYTCDIISVNRPWMDCSNPVVANNSLASNLLIFGFVGVFIFLILSYIRWGKDGLLLVYLFFGVEIFLVGYNAPLNFIVTGLIISAFMIAKKQRFNNVIRNNT